MSRHFVIRMKTFSYLCIALFTQKSSISMVRKLFFVLAMTLMAHSLEAQVKRNEPVRDPNNKYLVWTGNVRKADINSSQKVDSVGLATTEVQKAQSFMERYFPFRSMCDWKPGMRFMVLPDKKDMVVRTFTDSLTQELVSSISLRYKVMVYTGIARDVLHDRVLFREEKTNKSYYYELPTKSFEDYCYTKRGVPTLAYLDEVDTAMVYLVGKQLETSFAQYNIDVSTTSYGYDKVPVNKGTAVVVKAVGVGNRSFPVKLIVEDKDGNQFYQNVAISRTNSGLSDEEFEDLDNKKHLFSESFRMLGDDVAVTSDEYNHYIGKAVVTLYSTIMLNKYGMEEDVPRLSEFTIKSIVAMGGSDYVTLTLEKGDKTFTKAVTFVRHSSLTDGLAIDRREDYFGSLFRMGSLDMEGVRATNMSYIRQGIVKPGFTEEEVLLALGEPDDHGTSSRGTAYTWIYKSMINRTQCTVFFNNTTRRVTSVK